MKQHWRATPASIVIRPSARGRNTGILLDEDLPASEGFAKDADSLLSNCSLHNPWPFANISNQFEPWYPKFTVIFQKLGHQGALWTFLCHHEICNCTEVIGTWNLHNIIPLVSHLSRNSQDSDDSIGFKHLLWYGYLFIYILKHLKDVDGMVYQSW